MRYINISYYNYYIDSNNLDMKSFYSKLDTVDFKNITRERIEELKSSEACEVLKTYLYENRIKKAQKTILPIFSNINSDKATKYLKIINILKCNPNTGAKNILEKYILFILVVDPELDALIINLSCNNIATIKKEMEKRFGVYDKNLSKLERKLLPLLFEKKEIAKLTKKIDSIIHR